MMTRVPPKGEPLEGVIESIRRSIISPDANASIKDSIKTAVKDIPGPSRLGPTDNMPNFLSTGLMFVRFVRGVESSVRGGLFSPRWSFSQTASNLLK